VIGFALMGGVDVKRKPAKPGQLGPGQQGPGRLTEGEPPAVT